MNLSVEVQSATFDRAVVTVTVDHRRTIARIALRALVLQEVADRLGMPGRLPDLREATGYDMRDEDQWITSSRETPDGGRVLTFTVTVPTPEQKEAKLRREGGVIPNADGSFGFVFPSRRP